MLGVSIRMRVCAHLLEHENVFVCMCVFEYVCVCVVVWLCGMCVFVCVCVCMRCSYMIKVFIHNSFNTRSNCSALRLSNNSL